MTKTEALYYHLGFFWCLPISMIFWVLYGILYFCRQIDGVYLGNDLVLVWDLKNDGWLAKKFFSSKGWVGFSAGNNVLIMDTDNDPRWVKTLKHEKKHCYQQYKWGVIWIVLYLLEFIRIYLFEKDLHPYLDNCFEVEARAYAGQPIKIPRENWPDGENDRNPWV